MRLALLLSLLALTACMPGNLVVVEDQPESQITYAYATANCEINLAPAREILLTVGWDPLTHRSDTLAMNVTPRNGASAALGGQPATIPYPNRLLLQLEKAASPDPAKTKMVLDAKPVTAQYDPSGAIGDLPIVTFGNILGSGGKYKTQLFVIYNGVRATVDVEVIQ